MAEKSPAFQFYVKDWLGSQRVRLLTPEQRGCYMDLMAHCWDGPGLPDDVSELEVLSGYKGDNFDNRIWQKVSQFFYKGEDGKLHIERLDKERLKQKKFSKTQSKRSKHGWNTKKGNKLDDMPGASPGHAREMPGECPPLASPDETRAGYAFQSSSSFAFSLKEKVQKEKSDSFLNFNQEQIKNIKTAIAVALDHGEDSQANKVNFIDLRKKVEAYVARKRVPMEKWFNYAISSARNLGKYSQAREAENRDDPGGIPEVYRKELENYGIKIRPPEQPEECST